MKSQLSPAVTAGIIAAVVLVLGVALWRSLSGPPAPKATLGLPRATATAIGQYPPGVAPPGGAPQSLLPGGQAYGQPGTTQTYGQPGTPGRY